MAHLRVRVGHGGEPLGLLELLLQGGLGVLDGGVGPGVGVGLGLVGGGVGGAGGLVVAGAGLGLDLVRARVRGLLLGLALDRGLDHVGGAQPLELRRRPLHLHVLLQVLVLRLRRPRRLDPRDVHVAVQLGLLRREVRLRLGALHVPLRLLDRRVRVAVVWGVSVGKPLVGVIGRGEPKGG